MLVPDDEAKAAALKDMQEHAQHYATNLILPALAASLVVMLLVRLIGGRRAGSLATMLAMAAGVFVSGVAHEVVALPDAVESAVKPYLKNEISASKPWRIEDDRPYKVDDVMQVMAWTLEEKPPAKVDEVQPEDPPSMPKAATRRYWALCLAAVAMLLEFLLPLLRIPPGAAWTLRTMVALLAGRLVTPAPWRMAYPWFPWTMGFIILLQWGLLVSLTRRWRDGVVPTDMGLCLFLAGGVLMLSGYESSGMYLVMFAASVAGPALVSWIFPSDTSPALAACAVLLPSLMLGGLYDSMPEEETNFWNFQTLAALAPLALLPMGLPFLARLGGWRRWLLGLTLPLIPAVLAVVWVGV